MSVRARISILTLFSALALSGTAFANDGVPASAMGQFAAANGVGPDTHALRYFARQNDRENYLKEMARLRTVYPGFYVDPSALLKKDDTGNRLWELFATGEFDALREEIRTKQELDSTWAIDPELEAQLGLIDQRDQLLIAFERNDFAAVVDIASKHKHMLTSNRIDVVSAIGVALLHQGSIDAGIAAFEFGVRTGEDMDLIAVLVQRAARYLPFADSRAIYKTALDQPQIDDPLYHKSFYRGVMIRVNDNKFHIPAHYLADAEIFGERAKKEQRWGDVQLLAWSYYISQRYERAHHWFMQIPDVTFDDGKVLEGTVLSLKHMERIKDAVEIADKWKDEYEALALLYINLTAPELLYPQAKKLSKTFLETYADLTREYKSGEGAEALGWYAYNVRQSAAANAWFDKALDWRPTETAAFGKTLVASQTNDEELFEMLKDRYGDDYPRIAELEFRKKYEGQRRSASKTFTLTSQLARAHKNGQYKTCVSKSDRLIALGKMTGNDYQIRGWCLMKLDRPTEANIAFMKASTTETKSQDRVASNYGVALAALKQGHTDQAIEILRTNRLTANQRNTIQKALWAQQALAAFNQRRFADVLGLLNKRAQLETEPRNLSELRGWSFYNLGDYQSAHATFSYLDQVLSTRQSRDGLRKSRAKIGRSG